MAEESLTDFPFRKLRYQKYLTLDVMMHVEREEVFKFMFSVNKEARMFLLNNFITVRNAFINEGLITYVLKSDFNHFEQLEKLYLQALKRNIANRVLTIKLEYSSKRDFTILNSMLSWILAQQNHIKLRFKVKVSPYYDNLKEVKELNQNNIIELDVAGVPQDLSINPSVYQSLKCLYLDDDSFIKLNQLHSLQVLSINVKRDDFSKVIPYLASQFSQNHFKRMQIKLFLINSTDQRRLQIGDQNLDEYIIDRLPKSIEINTHAVCNPLEIDFIKMILASFNSSILSLNVINVCFRAQNFQELEILSNRAKKVVVSSKYLNDSHEIKQEYQANFQSVTDHLIVEDKIRCFNTLVQLTNFFKNIKTLEIKKSVTQLEITSKINLPLLQTLIIDESSQLSYFTGLKRLKQIEIEFWDEAIDDIKEVFDPLNILALESELNIPTKVLSMFQNLRSLRLLRYISGNLPDGIEQLLAQMNSLTSLTVELCNRNLNQFQNICNCCRQLRTFTIIGPVNSEDKLNFVQKMIEESKQNQRSSPFTLIFQSINESYQAVRVMNIVEEESLVAERLQVKFPQVNESRYYLKDVIPSIDPVKHPILLQYMQISGMDR